MTATDTAPTGTSPDRAVDVEALVAGSWRGASGGDWIDVLDPADQRVRVARVPALTAQDVAAAYTVAADAARAWRAAGPIARGAVLARAAGLLRERSQAIAADLVREMGKPLPLATVEVTKAADFLDYYAGLARLPYGQLVPDTRPDTTTTARVEPLGVVLLVTPWNDPLLTPARKLAPALAAGNAVVLKPATLTPLVALHLARALDDAGLPAGVLSVVTGRGRDLGAALLDHPALAAVSFTGSTAVGQQLQRDLAGRSVRVQTEMGGKNAAVVLADADLDLAAATIADAAFAQGGQRCTATSRLVADRRVAAELTDRLVARAAALVLGPGLDPATTMGPLASPEQRAETLEHVRRAEEEGARRRTGGTLPDDPALAHGCYVTPAVVDGVTPAMTLWSHEVFGPVLAVHAVDGYDEAVAAANDSVYGLSASVFTRSQRAAARFVDDVEAGQVAVNLPTSGWDVHHPFGGFRDSGSPFKEQGLEGLRFYTRIKTAAVRAID